MAEILSALTQLAGLSVALKLNLHKRFVAFCRKALMNHIMLLDYVL